jgi:peptidoglycan/xylan/chitin deacetylase (PgdA/CDA1 family)
MKKIAIFLFCALILSANIYYAEGVNAYCYAAAAKREVYLTFDDGPHCIYTEKILDVLKYHNVRATFFVVGENAANCPALLKRMRSECHTIGVHCYSHVYKNIYRNYQCFENDLQKCISAVSAVLPYYRLKYYRFPGGSFGKSDRIKNIIKKYSLQIIDWNAVNGDTENQCESADYVLGRVEATCAQRKKCVILMHDNKKITADTLGAVISALKAKGCIFKAYT